MKSPPVLSIPLFASVLFLATAAGDTLGALCFAGGDCPNDCMSKAKVKPTGVECQLTGCTSPDVCSKYTLQSGDEKTVWCACNEEEDPHCCTAFELWEYIVEPLPHWQLIAVTCTDPVNPCTGGTECLKNASDDCSCQ